jgi:hypothetical protein
MRKGEAGMKGVKHVNGWGPTGLTKVIVVYCTTPPFVRDVYERFLPKHL